MRCVDGFSAATSSFIIKLSSETFSLSLMIVISGGSVIIDSFNPVSFIAKVKK